MYATQLYAWAPVSESARMSMNGSGEAPWLIDFRLVLHCTGPSLPPTVSPIFYNRNRKTVVERTTMTSQKKRKKEKKNELLWFVLSVCLVDGILYLNNIPFHCIACQSNKQPPAHARSIFQFSSRKYACRWTRLEFNGHQQLSMDRPLHNGSLSFTGTTRKRY